MSLSRPVVWAALAAIVAVGGLLRVLPILATDFPLNDGGLFLTMARDLRANGWVPPATTTYNELGIPFAYPPLGISLVAALEAAGLAGLDVLRFLPLLASIATIPVAFLIGRLVFGRDDLALGTAAFFAISTGSYEWLVMGGGVTRAPGFLLALLTVTAAIRLGRTPSAGRWVVVTGVALGLTALLHPQATVFAALSLLVLAPIAPGGLRRAAWRTAAALGVGALIAAPWVIGVVAAHGVDPFVSAASSGGTPLAGLRSLLSGRTSGGQIEVLGILTSMAFVISALRRFWLAPVWMLAIVIVDSRAGQPYLALPAALAVAFLLGDVARVLRGRLSERRVVLATGVLAVVLVVASAADSLAAQRSLGSPLRSVTPDERAAMDWASESTPGDATFAVVAGRYWAMDAVAEWFPVLADRVSVTTVQGHEWLGTEAFLSRQELAGDVAPCIVEGDAACIAGWLETAGDPDYLLITRSDEAAASGLECCLQLAEDLEARDVATTVFERPGVVVMRLGP